MSLQAQPLEPIPELTSRIARASFPKGTLAMHLRDALGAIYEDADFADLFPKRGRAAEAPWRLALVTVLQALENLSDRQAAEMVRARLDWKYALSLPLDDEGFDWCQDLNKTVNLIRKKTIPVIVANTDRAYPLSASA